MGASINFGKLQAMEFTLFFFVVPISINGLGLQEFTIQTIFPMFSDVCHGKVLAVALILQACGLLEPSRCLFVSGISVGKHFRRNKRQVDTKE